MKTAVSVYNNKKEYPYQVEEFFYYINPEPNPNPNRKQTPQGLTGKNLDTIEK